MTFQNGTLTGPDNAIDTLKLFLENDGWTVNLYETDNTTYKTWSGLIGTGKRLHVQKTASDGVTEMYFNFRSVNRGIIYEDHYPYDTTKYNDRYISEVTGLGLYGSTGFDAEESWDYQPGSVLTPENKSWGVCVNGMSIAAVPGYIFSSNGDTVTIGIEYTSGKYQWLCFGKFDKTGAGAYNGGQFFTGSFSGYVPSQLLYATSTNYPFISFFSSQFERANGAVYLDADGVADWRISGGEPHWSTSDLQDKILFPSLNPSVTSKNYSNWYSFNGFFSSRSPNTFNNLPPFAMLYTHLIRADGRYSFIGQPSGIRFVTPENYSPGGEMPLGDDTWLIYPAHSKADPQGDYVGYAILK